MPPQVLKPSPLEIHKRHGHKNSPPFRNLIISATDSLSSLIKFSNCDDTALDYIIVKEEIKNMSSIISNSISETAINSETV